MGRKLAYNPFFTTFAIMYAFEILLTASFFFFRSDYYHSAGRSLDRRPPFFVAATVQVVSCPDEARIVWDR